MSGVYHQMDLKCEKGYARHKPAIPAQSHQTPKKNIFFHFYPRTQTNKNCSVPTHTVHASQQLPQIARRGNQNTNAPPRHGQQAHSILRIRLHKHPPTQPASHHKKPPKSNPPNPNPDPQKPKNYEEQTLNQSMELESSEKKRKKKTETLKKRSDRRRINGACLGLGAADEIDGVGLGLEPGRGVVAVPHPLRVVDADHRRLEKTNEQP